MRAIFKNNKGESLLETVIAFIVLAVGITIAGMILGASLRNMQNAKNRVIAVNIAREGIEAVRNIRDTNWLKFHSKRRACWNNAPAQIPEAPCDGMTPIEPDKYIIYKQGGDPPTYRWILEKLRTDGIQNLPSQPIGSCVAFPDSEYYNTTDNFTYKCDSPSGKWIKIATLSLVDIDPFVDTDLDHDYSNDEDIYNHVYNENNDSLGTLVKDSVFSRVITISYIKNNGEIVDSNAYTSLSGSEIADLNRMQVTSEVSWFAGNKRFKVELITHLTDYLGRENIEG